MCSCSMSRTRKSNYAALSTEVVQHLYCGPRLPEQLRDIPQKCAEILIQSYKPLKCNGNALATGVRDDVRMRMRRIGSDQSLDTDSEKSNTVGRRDVQLGDSGICQTATRITVDFLMPLQQNGLSLASSLAVANAKNETNRVWHN